MYKWVCPSVGWLVGRSVHWSVGPLVGWSVGNAFGGQRLEGEQLMLCMQTCSSFSYIFSFIFIFLVECTPLYSSLRLSVSPLVGWSVGRLVGWSVGRSVGYHFTFCYDFWALLLLLNCTRLFSRVSRLVFSNFKSVTISRPTRGFSADTHDASSRTSMVG